MDVEDLKAIGNLLDKKLEEKLDKKLLPIKKQLDNNTASVMKIEQKLDRNTASVLKIEQKIYAALELRQDVSEIRTAVKDHEERISQLETF